MKSIVNLIKSSIWWTWISFCFFAGWCPRFFRGSLPILATLPSSSSTLNKLPTAVFHFIRWLGFFCHCSFSFVRWTYETVTKMILISNRFSYLCALLSDLSSRRRWCFHSFFFSFLFPPGFYLSNSQWLILDWKKKIMAKLEGSSVTNLFTCQFGIMSIIQFRLSGNLEIRSEAFEFQVQFQSSIDRLETTESVI